MARALLALLLVLSACGGQASLSPSVRTDASSAPTVEATFSPAAGAVVPAPGSDSAVYAPNPGALVVAIDAGHGGCLDWGVPNPHDNTVENAEKTMTLGIARALAERLEAEGVNAVLIRDDDEALAGDDYPDLGCHGAPFRDVNGDGLAGFGDDLPEGTLARDELQSRLDAANVVRADALVSIHINSPFDAGQSIEIAFTETFYTDETPWGPDATERLATAIQSGVVDALAGVEYERGDRGITAHNFYIVAPPLFETTPERPDPRRQPARGALMPAVLSEVGSITLRAEAELLATERGQTLVADGLFDGLAAFLGGRPFGARIDPLVDAAAVGELPPEAPGTGPPYWAPLLPPAEDGVHALAMRLTNTGSETWPDGLELVAGREASDGPYLAAPPARLEPLEVDVPPLAPGESVEVAVALPAEAGARWIAWITLAGPDGTVAERGFPPLQMASDHP